MKILLSTNTWLYDIMIRSNAVWGQAGVEIIYDIWSSYHLNYYNKYCSNKNNILYVAVKTVVSCWDDYDISDNHIEYFENKYNIRFNEMIIYDLSLIKYDAIPRERTSISKEYWRKYFVGFFEYYENIFRQNRPDYVFGEGPHGLGMKILFEVAKKNKVPYFSFKGAYLIDNAMFTYGRTERLIGLEYFYKNHQFLSSENYAKADKLIEKVRQRNFVVYYQQIYGKPIRIFPKKLWRVFDLVIKYIKYLLVKTDKEKYLQMLLEGGRNPAWDKMFKRFKKYGKYKFVTNKSIVPENNREYLIYFNHYQPEATTSVEAPYNENQDNVIENIVKSMSGTMELYIKEHTTDMGNRGEKFYKNIMSYPNVKIISPFVNSFDLVKNARMVFTISGTVGFESIIMKKPVVVFSDCYYSFFPGVKIIRDHSDIPAAIEWGSQEYNVTEEQVRRFVAAYIRSLYQTKIGYPKLESEEIVGVRKNQEKFVNGILDYISDYEKYFLGNYLKCEKKL